MNSNTNKDGPGKPVHVMVNDSVSSRDAEIYLTTGDVFFQNDKPMGEVGNETDWSETHLLVAEERERMLASDSFESYYQNDPNLFFAEELKSEPVWKQITELVYNVIKRIG